MKIKMFSAVLIELSYLFPSVTISGDYGQLGHPTLKSTDEPQLVEFFKEQQMRVVDVVCGAWNTFVAVVEERVA